MKTGLFLCGNTTQGKPCSGPVQHLILEICKNEVISMFKIRTREHGSVLGNLDLNRTLVGDPYLETWICTWEPGPVLVFVLMAQYR